jgi:glutaredoxin
MTKVKVYSTTTCPYCHQLKSYLQEKHVIFEEIVLDYNPEKTAEAVHICQSMGVPCTHVIKDDGSEVAILGFDKQKLNEALGIK